MRAIITSREAVGQFEFHAGPLRGRRRGGGAGRQGRDNRRPSASVTSVHVEPIGAFYLCRSPPRSEELQCAQFGERLASPKGSLSLCSPREQRPLPFSAQGSCHLVGESRAPRPTTAAAAAASPVAATGPRPKRPLGPAPTNAENIPLGERDRFFSSPLCPGALSRTLLEATSGSRMRTRRKAPANTWKFGRPPQLLAAGTIADSLGFCLARIECGPFVKEEAPR
jgi:hypothetical protein